MLPFVKFVSWNRIVSIFKHSYFLVSNNKIGRKYILISESAQMFLILIPNNTKKKLLDPAFNIKLSTVFDESLRVKTLTMQFLLHAATQTIEQKYCWIWLVRCTSKNFSVNIFTLPAIHSFIRYFIIFFFLCILLGFSTIFLIVKCAWQGTFTKAPYVQLLLQQKWKQKR